MIWVLLLLNVLSRCRTNALDCPADEELKEPSGTLTSPLYPKTYKKLDNYVSCLWKIPLKFGEIVEVKITDLDLEFEKSSYDANCPNNNLDLILSYKSYIRNFKSHFIRYCSWKKAPPEALLFQSVENEVIYLQIRSDMSREVSRKLRGFKLTYKKLKKIPQEKTECFNVLKGKRGSITSPNYPQNYTVNQTCIWSFQLEPTEVVKVNIDTLNIEDSDDCQHDKLEIITDPKFLGERFCGNGSNIVRITKTNQLKILFKSDGTISGPGFKLSYTVIDLHISIKEINEQFSTFVQSLKETYSLAVKIQKKILAAEDANNLLLMPKIRKYQVIVAFLNTTLLEFSSLDVDIKERKKILQVQQNLQKMLGLYKILNLRRAEFTVMDIKLIFQHIVQKKLLTQLRDDLDLRSQEVLQMILHFATMEKSAKGAVFPGVYDMRFTLDNMGLKSTFKNLFKDLVQTTVKSITTLGDIENVYSNFSKFIGNTKSTTPFIHIANLADSTIDVAQVLIKSTDILLAESRNNKIKRDIVLWFKGPDGYFEMVRRMEVLKKLLLKISKYRDMKKWNGISPEKFFDNNLNDLQMVLDEKFELKRSIDEL